MEQAEPCTPPTKPQAKTFEQVRQHMNELFGLEEIRVLVFVLDIDYDNLVGETKNGKIISLLIDLAQHQRLTDLETKLNNIRPQVNWQFSQAKFPVSQAPLDKNRTNFLNIMQNTWINGFLYQSLHSEVIKLTMTAPNGEMLAQGAWRRSWQMMKQQQNMADELVPLDKPVGEIFEESGQGLLILGAPGSGKTITLLQLAEDLLAEANFPGQPMPVVLNLSSWAQEKQSLADWLEAEIFVQYGVGRNLAKQWLESNSLIYLLDGLDEVAEEARDACITAINQFREDKPGEPGIVPMVVCSRMADYEKLSQRLNLNTAIQIQPLSDEQVDSYLSHEKLELQTVRGLLQDDPPLRELTRSPLLLNVMTLAYKDAVRLFMLSKKTIRKQEDEVN